MSRLFYHVMQDFNGNLLTDVTGTMRLAGTSTLATLYGDEAMTVIIPNPMTNHTSFGSFKCFLDAGDYDFYMQKAGYTFETLTGVQGYGTMAQQNADGVVITGGSAVLAQAQVATLGLGRIPNPAYALAVGTLPSHFATDVAVATALGVGGLTQLSASVGIMRAPNASYSLAVGTLPSHFDGAVTLATDLGVGGQTQLSGPTGVGRVPNTAYALAVGGLPSHFATGVVMDTTLAVGGLAQLSESVGIMRAPDASYALVVDTLPSHFDTNVTIFGTLGLGQSAPGGSVDLAVAGQSQLDGPTGIGRTPNPAYALAVGGLPSNFDTAVTLASTLGVTGQTQLSGPTGIGRAPNASYALAVGGLPSNFDTAVTVTSTLGVTGQTQLSGPTGIGRAPNASYALAVGTLPSHFDGAVVVDTTLGVGGQTQLSASVGIMRAPSASYALAVDTLPSHFTTAVTIAGATLLQSPSAIGTGTPNTEAYMTVWYHGNTRAGMLFRPTDMDNGTWPALYFQNMGGLQVGSIRTTSSDTSYLTTSDVRLKRDITPLAGALDVVRALRPVSFLWNADGSRGHGFLAHELQQHIPAAVSGTPDAADAEGNIQPQGVDHSKLVPWLTAALQEVVAQVQALTARVAVLENARGA